MRRAEPPPLGLSPGLCAVKGLPPPTSLAKETRGEGPAPSPAAEESPAGGGGRLLTGISQHQARNEKNARSDESRSDAPRARAPARRCAPSLLAQLSYVHARAVSPMSDASDPNNVEPLIRGNLGGLRKLYSSLTLRSLSMSTTVCERDFLALMHELTAVRLVLSARRGALAFRALWHWLREHRVVRPLTLTPCPCPHCLPAVVHHAHHAGGDLPKCAAA